MIMTPKKRENVLKRISDIETKRAELSAEKAALLQSLEDDDKERLVGAVKKTGLSIDEAIALFAKSEAQEKGNTNVTFTKNDNSKQEVHENEKVNS